MAARLWYLSSSRKALSTAASLARSSPRSIRNTPTLCLPTRATMATVATLPRLAASQLSEMILAEESAGTAALAIIDVRDDDYIGGHIKGSQNWPSHKLDVMLPTLIRQLQDKSCVVFHCALSQQRGPGAALRYIRERQRLLESAAQQQPGGQVLQDKANISPSDEQKVYVLDKGFVGWQEQFGRDQRLTQNYRKELWEN